VGCAWVEQAVGCASHRCGTSIPQQIAVAAPQCDGAAFRVDPSSRHRAAARGDKRRVRRRQGGRWQRRQCRRHGCELQSEIGKGGTGAWSGGADFPPAFLSQPHRIAIWSAHYPTQTHHIKSQDVRNLASVRCLAHTGRSPDTVM